MKHDNQLEIKDGCIVIQSCDKSVANIGIFYNGKNAYHHVSVPELVREWRLVKYSELSLSEYDRILTEYRLDILFVINRLNHPPIKGQVVCSECGVKVDIDETEQAYNPEIDDVFFYCKKCYFDLDDGGEGIGFAEIHGW